MGSGWGEFKELGGILWCLGEGQDGGEAIALGANLCSDREVTIFYFGGAMAQIAVVRGKGRILLGVVASLVIGGSAWARTPVEYDEAKVQEAMKEGKPVLVEVFADWCPSCKKTHVALEKALDTMPEVQAFGIDFDKDEELLKRYAVEEQGTLLIVKEGKEVARLAGETSAEKIGEWIKGQTK